MSKTKGSIEAEISKAITQWEKDYLGRGSVSVKTDILRNMVIVTLQGILTPAEYVLCNKQDQFLTVKRTRSDLVESGIDELKQLIFTITEIAIISFHTDLSTRTGERVMIFKMEDNLEERLIIK
ncbi:uncharacterized protein YbcI [Salirhabdus euzebyi]|uniref:Uncharacterized protein YbcI n=1 Tax=Salirhabdus euzebyi TaxID=394506 RepID=A0A841PWW6_9BACI|nr:DUF2294 domain-containing protein [Salirhabdus euzebyi]MBB6451856.1 uncharacterized protein YbcI [Salirhabdus euzebyi]